VLTIKQQFGEGCLLAPTAYMFLYNMYLFIYLVYFRIYFLQQTH